MTMKIADAAPEEAQLVEISERLYEAFSTTKGSHTLLPLLDLDSSYLAAARTMLLSLSESIAPSTSGGVPLTRQQIESYLDFDPDFTDAAKDMLKDFIDRTEARRHR